MRVLLVDDEYYFRQAMKCTFPWEKYNLTICSEAKNGQEALKQIQYQDPDILIVDINMPKMDGLQFLEAAMQINPHMKFIIVSGYSEFEYAKKAIEL